MKSKRGRGPLRPQLLAEIEDVRARLAEAEQTLRAVREGDVDALVVSGSKGEREQTLRGAKDRPEIRIQQRTAELESANRALQKEIAERRRAEELEAANEELQVQAEELRAANKNLRAQEQTVHDRENELRLVANMVPALIAYIDPKFRYRWVNQGYERWFGLAFQEVEGRHVRDVLGEKAWRTVRPHLEQALAGKVVTYEEQMPYRVGEPRWVRVTCMPDRDDAGRVRGFVAHVTDIGESKKVEQELTYLASFPQRNPNPVLEVTLDGGIRYLNPAAERLFPDLREQGTAHPWLTDWPAVVRPFQQGQTDTGVRDLTVGTRTYQQAFYYSAQDCFVRIYAFDVTARKQAEEALHAAHAKISSVLETMSDCFVTFSRDWRYTYVNAAAAKAFGMTAPQLLGRTIWDVWPAAYDLPLGVNFRRSLQENLPIQFEQFYPAPLNRWFECRCHPTPEGLATFFSDVTERKRAEEALRQAHESLQAQSEELAAANEELRVQAEQMQESEQRLRMALEAGAMGHWGWDLQKDAVSWCERSYELLGLRRSAPATDENFFRCVHPEDREALEKLAARVLAEPADFQLDFRVIHHQRDGRGGILWLSSRGKVIRDAEGRGVRMIGVLYDITPRKQMEEQLRQLNDQLEEEVVAQTEELRDSIDRLQDEVVRRVLAEGKLRKRSQMLEAFFQHTIAPLAFLDKHFNFVQVNEAYARAEGQTPEYFVKKNYFALHPDEENRALFERVVQTGQPYYAYAQPFRPQQPGRGVSYWNWQLTPLRDERGQLHSLVFSREDVTERQKAFQELEQRARQLQKLTLELSVAEDRERRRLAEILHDDLQQQLAAAKFHLGILAGHVKDNKALHETAGQVNQMLKEAIGKSRSLSHELSPPVLYQSDLGETFEWLARQVQAKHGLTVHVEVRGRVDSPSEALKAFLYKAAQELLFNVVKHARTKETRLRVQRMRDQLWLTIGDRGQGFEPQTLSKTAGFGLLSIRERVELLGGRMKIKSARGRGSTFLIAVPDSPAPAAAPTPGLDETPTGVEAAAPKKAAPDPAALCLRVLLADDHEVMREGLAALLGEYPDIEIVGQAGNGREAVDLACQLRPDVIIMDAAMPVMPGDEATQRIKQHLPATRVVALSMFEEPEIAERMCRAGAEVFLLKTAPADDLLAAIRGRPPQK